MMLRLSLFSMVFLSAVFMPTVVFALLALFYALRYTALELVFVAAFIDAYYGGGYPFIPYYTLVVTVVLILIEWIKPSISVYNDPT